MSFETERRVARPPAIAGGVEGVVAIGRAFIGALYLVSGIGKALGWAGMLAMLAGKGFPKPDIVLAATIAFEVAGGVMLIVGWHDRLAAAGLAIFTLVAGIIFHDFWAAPAAQYMNQFNHFMKNVAIVGGLCVIAGRGARPVRSAAAE